VKLHHSAVAVALFVTALHSPAAAHLALRSPQSRYGDFVLKEGPCGVAGGQRSTHVTVVEPGASIQVVWDEYVDHPGHFRVAFDVDGDDDFVDPACLGGCDTRAPDIELYANAAVLLDGIADTQGGESGVTVRLPDVECERCTLQAIQVMYDKPPYVTPGNDIYYQCADLALRRGAAATATPTEAAAPATFTATPAPTDTPVCAALATPACACVGDCDGNGRVTVSELITIVRIALGNAALSACASCDVDGDGGVEVGEIVAAVRRGLDGCFSVPP